MKIATSALRIHSKRMREVTRQSLLQDEKAAHASAAYPCASAALGVE